MHGAGIAAVPARDASARAQAYFARWGDEGEVDLSKAFAELIILTASRTLMGARWAAAARGASAGARLWRGRMHAGRRSTHLWRLDRGQVGQALDKQFWHCAEACMHMGRAPADLGKVLHARGAAPRMDESGGVARHRASVNPSPRPWPGRVSFR